MRAWFRAFIAEALPTRGRPTHAEAEAHLERSLDIRLGEDKQSGICLWDHEGDVVSLAAFGGETPNGMRIGPVYTPPERRRRGYASAITAALSEQLLASGRRFCFLYTDLANPTSNRIYRAIGYEHVCDSAEIVFERIASGTHGVLDSARRLGGRPSRAAVVRAGCCRAFASARARVW